MGFDVLLAAALALIAGGTLPIAPVAASAGFAAALLLTGAALGRRAALCCAVLFALGGLRGSRVLQHYDSARFELRDAIGQPRRCAFSARVVSSPVKARDSLNFLAQVEHAECEGVRLPPFRARLYGGPEALGRGDLVTGTVDFAPAQLFRNFGAADPRPSAARSGAVASGGALALTVEQRSFGPKAWIDRARAHVRARIEATFPPLSVGLARALVLGESDLDPDDDAAFRASGLSHLLAVSGTHLVFAVVALVNAIAFLLVRIEAFAASVRAARVAAAVGVVLSLGYADFAGGSGSAFRAAYMLSVAFLVTAAGRRPSAVRCLAASMLIGALLDPLVAFDISFLLSVAATAGLIGLGPALSGLVAWARPRPLAWLLQSLTTTLSAMLPCVPLLALLSSEVGVAGLLANVVAGPVGEMFALPLCLLHTVVGFWPGLERGVAMAGGGALLVVRAIARLSAEQSALRVTLPVPSGFQIALAALLSLALFVGAGRPKVWARRLLALGVGGLGLGALELTQRQAGAPRGKLVASVLDVGQGDATLLNLPDGSLWLIDGGGFVGSPVDPGRSVILPELRSRRRARIDVMVLSHPHPDHFLGLESVIRAVEVGQFWDTGQGLAQGAGPAYARIRALLRERGVPVLGPRELCGQRALAGAVVQVLAPCPDFRREWGANDNSLVIRVALGGRAFLFTGDAEHDAEALLLERGALLRADFLKVGHHGSRTSSTPAFLDAVRPRIASMSTGVRNRFGHPHPTTLRSLDQRQIGALRTDRLGGIRIETDGRSLDVRHVASGR
ncbi:MAG TPA: ComEC/Rec2 family competence protein [Polyangiaceae bacterium]|nr:ComEC/Rec2 family competence protein [Polyangiaceae bacterium]